MTQYKLAPCPFCGDAGNPITDSYYNHWVICENCGVSTSETGAESQEAAIAKWNRRAPIPQSQSLLSDEEIRETLRRFQEQAIDSQGRIREIEFARAIESKVRQQDEEVRRDAERYKHVRAKPEMLLHLSNKDFDTAINAAIAKQKGEQNG
jgi:Lar family restriction alleviation protein